MNIEGLKSALLGSWQSIAPEMRPSKNPDGTLKAFYLSRRFTYFPGDRFELAVMNYGDALGKVQVTKIEIAGHMSWHGEHPIAPGAQKVDFVADESYEVTPLIAGFADILNKVADDDYTRWELGEKQSIFGKSFLPFGLVKGQNFKEYDLVHVAHGSLFWGARHVDGRGFDTEANRPTNLQIPLAKAP